MKRRSTLFISLVFFTGCGLSSPADLPDAESGGQTTVGDVPTASTPKVADAAHQGNPTDPASALGRCAKDGFYCLATAQTVKPGLWEVTCHKFLYQWS